jgi:hypothetical protein
MASSNLFPKETLYFPLDPEKVVFEQMAVFAEKVDIQALLACKSLRC